jgi:hypothetical protein
VKPSRPAALVFVALAVLAAALRFTALATRPMHADEAVHADKLGTLVEGRGYAYDPAEYHGPTLYYLTLVPAWIAGARRYVDLDETTLRSVPAAVGTLLVAAHFLARPLLGTTGAWLPRLRGDLAGDGLLQPVLHPRGRAGRRELRRPCACAATRRPGRSRRSPRGFCRADAGDQGDGADRSVACCWRWRQALASAKAQPGSGPPRRPRRRRGLRGRGVLLVVPPPPERRRGRGARLRPPPRARDHRLAARPPVAFYLACRALPASGTP